MAGARGTVTVGTGGGQVVLVTDIDQYQPFGEAYPLGVTAFAGIDSVTIQDFKSRIARATGRLTSGGGENAGLIKTSQLTALLTLLTAWGVSQPLTDSLGNAGTIKALSFTHNQAYVVPVAATVLFSYELRWHWLTLTTRYGVAYTDPV
jgi:hypothetical protein